MSNKLPDRTPKNLDAERVSLVPSMGKWKHPDPRLAAIIVNASVMGTPATRIAKIVSVDLRTLKQFYSPELEHGRSYASLRLLDHAHQMALSGSEKMTIYLLKNWVEPHAAEQAGADESEKVADKNGLALENLSVEELKEFTRLINKAKPAVDSKTGKVREGSAEA